MPAICPYQQKFIFLLSTFFSVSLQPNTGHGVLIHEVSRSHTTTHHSR